MKRINIFLYELKKIMLHKRVHYGIGFILLMSSIVGILDGYDYSNKVKEPEIYNNIVMKHEGIIEETSDMIHSEKVKSFEVVDIFGERMKKQFEEEYSEAMYNLKQWNGMIEKGFSYRLSKKYLNNILSNTSKLSTFEYRDLQKNLDMLNDRHEPEYYNTHQINSIYYIVSGKAAFLMMVIILLLIAPVFADENHYNIEKVILSTKNGRQKIVNAKIGASLLVSSIWISLFYIINIIVRLISFKSLHVLDIPLCNVNGYLFTPFNWSVMHHLILCYLFTVLTSGAFTVLACVFSVTSKHTIRSFLCGIAFILLPLIFEDVNIIGKAFMLLPSATFNSDRLFQKYTSYNIMNTPVLYPYVVLVANVFIIVIGIITTKKLYNRKLM